MLQEKLIEDYEINPRTMFIIPVKYGSKTYSKIYEVDDVFLSPLSPLRLSKGAAIILESIMKAGERVPEI